ncbi:MAG: chemotaxis response regulator protein-glutamate methylesterase [Chlorobiaceae bacterium]|nr:chemotaxis response regulator protein-glutamate methylesterase [Chlorobiaceae bacterium]MBA4310959.1 chemotaxis response regulator protein-glutamate methylesterase [Chlorobiaceae bacterium]
MTKIRAVIVDDSAFMRKSLSIMLEGSGEIEIIGTAKDGIEGYNLVKATRPDIVTLDIEMPKMDGLTALKKIMADCPTPVLMVSSLTTEGAESTLKALEYGAVDFIPKELSFINVNIIKIKEDLIRKVKEIVKQKSLQDHLRRLKRTTLFGKQTSAPVKSATSLPRVGYKAISLGVSTGGPLSLQKVIPRLLPKLNVPFFIVQHMPPVFTKSLAERLNSMSELQVKEAEHGEQVKNNFVYLAPGGFHMTLKKNLQGNILIDISEFPMDTLHRPSVDVTTNSVVKIYGNKTLGVMMTGMGKDGFESFKVLKSLGGHCLAQDEESCVVYGMPKAVVEGDLADVVTPLENISKIINEAF